MGGGAGGIELSLSMHHRMTEELQRTSARKVKVKCVPTIHSCLRPGWSPAGLEAQHDTKAASCDGLASNFMAHTCSAGEGCTLAWLRPRADAQDLPSSLHG